MRSSKAVRYLFQEKRLLGLTSLVLVTQSFVTVLLPLPLKLLTDKVFIDAQRDSYALHFWAGARFEVSVGYIIFYALLSLFILGTISAVLEYYEERKQGVEDYI